MTDVTVTEHDWLALVQANEDLNAEVVEYEFSEKEFKARPDESRGFYQDDE